MKTVLRQETDHAVRMLMDLGDRSGRFVPVGQVASETGVTKAFAHKILQKLRSAGIVECRRGAGGGVAMAVRPRDVNLLHLLELMQGPFLLSRCAAGEGGCRHCNTCRLHNGLAGLQEQFVRLFSRLTLADLMADSRTASVRRSAANR